MTIIAVGPSVTQWPPPRSRRADFPHRNGDGNGDVVDYVDLRWSQINYYYGPPQCPAARAWMHFRSLSGTFGPALCPGSLTGVLYNVIVRGIERRALMRQFHLDFPEASRVGSLTFWTPQIPP